MTTATDINKVVAILPRLNDYVALVTELNAEYWNLHNFTHAPAPVASLDSVGKRFAKVAVSDSGHARVHSFIDLDNGDIIKGTWKAPIRTPKKGLAVRGNIFADDLGKSNVNWHGPKYLK